MIKVQNLYKSFGSLVVLSDVSFSLERGQKVALVGYNGTGKTTLLKIIAGIETQDSGKIDIAKDACIGYLPQDTSLTGNKSIIDYLRDESGIGALEVEMENLSSDLSNPEKAKRYGEVHYKYEHLGGYSFTHKVKIILTGFGFDEVELNRSLSNLSSGQKSKVVLAGILLKGVDILLLDEPTNNLDLPALIWLEDFLQTSDTTCIVISHDRRFLDRVVKKILEIDWHTHSLTVNGGTYSNYLEMLVKRIRRQKEEYRLQQEEIERLSERARERKAASLKGSNWSGSDNDKFLRGFKRDKAAKSSKVAKAIEKRIEQMDKVEKPVERKPFEILLGAEINPGTLDVNISDLVVGYPESFVLGPLSLEIRYGNRVGIMGLNGAGKSTLLKAITGESLPISGKVEIGSGIKVGNMMQEHETLPRDQISVDYLSAISKISIQESYSLLSKFGFDERQAKLPISTLSPGGRARLLFAIFSAQSVNLLVLDEPTNHLDIEALEALEDVLSNYKGTVILVSHDRYLIEKTSLDTFYILSDGKLSKVSDYTEYIKRAEEKARKLCNLL
ncbi:MAG: ABC-F family ATP-binding cassette domain-containing protein [Candidatus Paceibacterota bacterium]|jgi:ATP-binding cassette subfamily F protein 3